MRWSLSRAAPLSTVCDQLQQHASTIHEVNQTTWNEAVSTAYQKARDGEKPLSASTQGGGGTLTVPTRAAPEPEVLEPPRHLRAGKSYVAQIVELIRQATMAAHTLHEVGVVHRDIKPGNIIVTADGRQAVLMDLGLAQLANETEGYLHPRPSADCAHLFHFERFDLLCFSSFIPCNLVFPSALTGNKIIRGRTGA